MPLSRLFLTCPIFYVNAQPHLGHAYTLCLADAWARYAAIRGDPALTAFNWPNNSRLPKFWGRVKRPTSPFLSVGTDEHGLKVKQAASRVGKPPLEYCDMMAPLFKSLCKHNSVSVQDFVRTSEERHEVAVQELWRRLDHGGHLYEHNYSGWYSISDEAFYSERELTAVDGSDYVVTESGNPVEWTEETNILFRLTPFKDQIHEWLDTGVFLTKSPAQKLWLEKSHSMVDAASDVSVSRPSQRLDWGIRVPDCPDQVIYVWLDALTNYLTVAGFPDELNQSTAHAPWPPDYQFIGMDILRFHVVLWPAVLMALDLPLPRHVICHHHILVDGTKMSKSKGNVFDPFLERVALTPGGDSAPISDSEGFRYVLLRSALLSQNVSYSRDLAKQIINAELVNCLGNLLSRLTAPALNPHQSIIHITREEAGAIFTNFDEDAVFLEHLDSLASRFDAYWWEQAAPHKAIDQVLNMLRETNSLVDRYKPWSKDCLVEPEYVIAVAAESLRIAGCLLRPVIPHLAGRLLQRLGIERNDDTEAKMPATYERLFQRLGSDDQPFLRRLS